MTHSSHSQLRDFVQRNPPALFITGLLFAALGVAAIVIEPSSSSRYARSEGFIDVVGVISIVLGVGAAIVGLVRMVGGSRG